MFLCYICKIRREIVVVLGVFGAFLETFFIICVGYKFIGISFKTRLIPILVVSFYGSIVLVMIKEVMSPGLYLIILILIIGFLLTFATNLNFLASITAILLGCISLIVSEVLGSLLLKEVPYISLNTSPLVRLIPNLLIMGIIFIILKTTKFKLPISFRKIENKNHKMMSVLFLLFGTLFLFYIFIFEYNQLKFFHLLSTILVVIITLSVLYLIHHHMVTKIENLTASIDIQYEEDILKQIGTIRSLRHDFIHHILALKKMLNNEKYRESIDYINSVLDETSYISDVLPVASEAIGGLLLSYKEKAINKGINIYYHISDDLSNFPCKFYETNRILGNLLLNAIEAVEQLDKEKRYINLKIYRDKKFFIIELSNFMVEEVLQKSINKIFNRGFTTKNNASNNGQGLTIVENIVLNYGGHIHLEVIDDMITFIVKIPYGGHYA